MRKRIVALAALALAVLTPVATTSAGFTDTTHAASSLATAAARLDEPPVYFTSASGSGLWITQAGELYQSGDRRAGDGAGGTTANDAAPTKVAIPDDVRIIDAVGGSTDFHYPIGESWYAALDDRGRVWTWGTAQNAFNGEKGRDSIGRGRISQAEQYRAGLVITADRRVLSGIVRIARTENQVLALDADGNLWTWGSIDNIARPDGRNVATPYPIVSNDTCWTPGSGRCTPDSPDTAGKIRWRSVWNGANLGLGVGRNGLIYTWGWYNSNGLSSGQVHTFAPTLNEGANLTLFGAYPEIYRTGDGLVYDPKVQTTAQARHRTYVAIVTAMKDKALPVCDSTIGQLDRVDDTCPVRQAAMFDLAGSFLLQNGALFTWAIDDGRNGFAFLGRSTTTDPASSLDSTYRYSPGRVSIAGEQTTFRSYNATLTSLTAITTTGEVYGWGVNGFCQAIGRHVDGSVPCTTLVASEQVLYPTRVAELNRVAVREIRTAACTTWALAEDGSLYAWGGAQNVASFDFSRCGTFHSGSQSYSFLDITDPTGAPQAFSRPLRQTATGTVKVK